jgi:hypothetical protein
VAITRAARDLAAEIPTLAGLLGHDRRDLALRLRGPLPLVIVRTRDAEQAAVVLSTLRELEHGAVLCDLARVEASRTMFSPRTISMAGDALVVAHPGHGRREVRLGELAALIRATCAVPRGVSRLSLQRQRFASRRVFAEVEQVLYLFGRSMVRTVLVREWDLRFSLGERFAPTTAENFAITVDALRRAAPDAFFDDRLLGQMRRTVVAGAGIDATSSTTSLAAPLTETDLAAHLLTLARLERQL